MGVEWLHYGWKNCSLLEKVINHFSHLPPFEYSIAMIRQRTQPGIILLSYLLAAAVWRVATVRESYNGDWDGRRFWEKNKGLWRRERWGKREIRNERLFPQPIKFHGPFPGEE